MAVTWTWTQEGFVDLKLDKYTYPHLYVAPSEGYTLVACGKSFTQKSGADYVTLTKSSNPYIDTANNRVIIPIRALGLQLGAGTCTISLSLTVSDGTTRYQSTVTSSTVFCYCSPAATVVDKPTLTWSVKEYSSSGRAIEEEDFSDFNSTAYYLTCATQTTPGAYTCTVTCNSGYTFDDGTTASYNWEIHKTNITKPTQIKVSTDYTGGYQAPTSSWFSGWSDWCTLNVTQQINHPDTPYSGTITLFNSYCYWSGGGQDTISFSWTINKIYQTLSFYPSSDTIVVGDSTTATIQGNPVGSYGQPTGQSHTTATYNLGTISVTGVSVGTDTLRVTYGGDQNHYSGYAEFTVTVQSAAPSGKIMIKTSAGWRSATPYIKTSSGWRQAKAWVKNNTGWHECNS